MLPKASIRSSILPGFLRVSAACCATFGLHATGFAAEDVQNGQKLYASFGCYQCHGHHGQGGNAGPKLAPDPLPFEAFQVFVRTPVARMPPYTRDVLSDEQLEQMHRYLASLEHGPPASEIPLLDLTIQSASD